MASILWLSADPVAEAAIGVTDRSEGVRHFLRNGHQVTLVCGGRPGHRAVRGVPTVFLPVRYVPALGWLWLWPRLIRALDRVGTGSDVLVTDFALLPAVMWWRSTRGSRTSLPAVVLDVRTPPVEAGAVRAALQRWRFRTTLRRLGRRVDAITAITDGLRDEVARLARVPAHEVAVWGSGCSWCDEEPKSWRGAGASEPRLADGVVVIYHGSLSAGRGLFEAIRAMAALRSRAPDLRLVLLGDGPARVALRSLVAEFGLEDRVSFLDPVPHDQVLRILQQADLGLVPLPRKWEWEVSSPLKLVEYFCAGLPVVLTDIRAHELVPRDAPFAFRSPTADPADLADALMRAYGRRDELEALGQQAAAWSRPRLGWSGQLAILEDVVDRLVVRRAVPESGSGMKPPGIHVVSGRTS